MKIRNMFTGETLEAECSPHSFNIYRLNNVGDFYIGDFHRSENGRFILSWSDIADLGAEGIRGGAREKGFGRYLLIDEDKLILQGKLERPHDGKVSDQGIFILNDWMFGSGLIGTFYAFDLNGQKLIQHKFRANLFNNGISRDGRFAVCQTLDSNNEDGNRLCLFDLIERRLMWKLEPTPDRADKYGFEPDKRILYLLYENGMTYRYGFDGSFLDLEE